MKKVVLLFFVCCFALKGIAGYNPVTIASGFNSDLVANGIGDASLSSSSFDVPNNYAFLAADFQATSSNSLPTNALPASGSINSEATTGLTFQMASYSGNNALLLTETTNTGTLNLTAANVSNVYLLTSAANGNADFDVTVNFSDGSSQQFLSQTASDWFWNSDYAIKGMGRVNRGNNNLDNQGDNDNPRLYQVNLALNAANYSKTISSISFTTTATGGTTMAVLAVSVNNVCTGTPSLATTTSSVSGACAGVSFTLSLNGLSNDPGLSYQWETSTDGNTWVAVSSGGNDPTFTTTQSAATYYHCIVTCTLSSLSSTSSTLSVTQNAANQCYCIPDYFWGCDDGGTYYDINSVLLPGENGTSIDNQSTGCSGNGYMDYTSSIAAVDLQANNFYNLTLTTQNTNVEPSASVWIDFDNSGTFDSNEMVGTTGTTVNDSVEIALPFITAGLHHMRIRTAFYNAGTVDEPCAQYSEGEAEDYMVNILPPPTCLNVTNLTVTNPTAAGTASATWDAGTSGTTYDWVVDQSNTNAPTATSYTTTSTPAASISGLIPGVYYTHVRAHCSASDSSVWVKTRFVIPSACSNAITILSGQTVTGNNTGFDDVTLPAGTCGDQFQGFQHGIWYKFTTVDTGSVTISTCGGASWNTYLRVYSGDCTNLTCVGFDDNFCNVQSSVSFTSVANQTYYVLLGSYADYEYGAYTLNASFPGIPVNDNATGAVNLNVNQTCSGPNQINTYASSGIGEPYPNCSGIAGGHSVWYKFVAPSSGTVKISTDNAPLGTFTNSKIALFQTSDSSNYSNFSLLSCDENNGVTDAGNMSIIYATGLTAGNTYYVEVDGSTTTDMGTFCISVQEINSTMISQTAVACQAFQQPSGTNSNYTGWTSLVDNSGNIVAIVRNPAGSAPTDFSGSYTVTSGAPRQDNAGHYYLSRNYYISNPSISTPVDVVFMISPNEFYPLAGFLGISPASLQINLNVNKQEGTSCSSNFSQTNGPSTVLLQNINGQPNGATWIQISTSSFSNFYLMNGITPLNITLNDISAENQGKLNKIKWSTDKEEQGDYFELERSKDAKTFELLSKINGSGKSNNYDYMDVTPFNGINYYRLKLQHANGTYTYSKVVEAKVTSSGDFAMTLYPNPTQNTVHIQLNKAYQTQAQLCITDLSGRTLETIEIQNQDFDIDLSRYATGVYLIKYKDDQRTETIKISKQ